MSAIESQAEINSAKLKALLLVDNIEDYIKILNIYSVLNPRPYIKMSDIVDYYIFDNMSKPVLTTRGDKFPIYNKQQKIESNLYKKLIRQQDEYNKVTLTPFNLVNITELYSDENKQLIDLNANIGMITNICLYKVYNILVTDTFPKCPAFYDNIYHATNQEQTMKATGGWIINTDGTLSQVNEDTYRIVQSAAYSKSQGQTYAEELRTQETLYKEATKKNIPYLDIPSRTITGIEDDTWKEYSRKLKDKIDRAYRRRADYFDNIPQQQNFVKLTEIIRKAFYNPTAVTDVEYNEMDRLFSIVYPDIIVKDAPVSKNTLFNSAKKAAGSVFSGLGYVCNKLGCTRKKPKAIQPPLTERQKRGTGPGTYGGTRWHYNKKTQKQTKQRKQSQKQRKQRKHRKHRKATIRRRN